MRDRHCLRAMPRPLQRDMWAFRHCNISNLILHENKLQQPELARDADE